MDPLALVITNAGLDALVDAGNGETESIRIVEFGITAAAFDVAPTLVVLPGEFKRVPVAGGQSVAPNVIHMTAQDNSADTYDVRGFGLYLADGTLFAAFSQADALFRKVSIASFLLAFDIKVSADVAASIDLGDIAFVNPPASETVKGVARIATQARVDAAADAGDDGETIVTPKTLRARLAAFFAAVANELATLTETVNAALEAFAARTITGGGLAAGGGDLTADRVITVTAADAAQVEAGTADDVVLTPAAIGPLGGVFGTFGYAREAGGKITQWGTVTLGATEYAKPVTLPLTFPNAILNVVVSYASNPANADDEADENLWAAPAGNGTITIYGSSLDDYGPRSVSFQVIGH